MEIKEISIDLLKPYEHNPRHNEAAVGPVANSIKQFGFKVPIIIDKDNVIIAGHTRLKAAKLLGLETVPCVLADDLTEEQAKAFRLADNKVSEMASWDFKELQMELDELKNLDLDFEMADFGFNDADEPDQDDDHLHQEQEIDQDDSGQKIICPKCGTKFKIE